MNLREELYGILTLPKNLIQVGVLTLNIRKLNVYLYYCLMFIIPWVGILISTMYNQMTLIGLYTLWVILAFSIHAFSRRMLNILETVAILTGSKEINEIIDILNITLDIKETLIEALKVSSSINSTKKLNREMTNEEICYTFNLLKYKVEVNQFIQSARTLSNDDFIDKYLNLRNILTDPNSISIKEVIRG